MRALALTFTLLASLVAGEAKARCLDALLGLLPVAQSAKQRGFDGAAYEIARSRWADRLAGVPAGEPRGDVIRAALEAETIRTPEEIFALADALEPRSGATFYDALKAIQARGVGIVLRNYRLPYGMRPSASVESGAGSPRAPTHREQRAGRRFFLLPGFLFPERHLLIIDYPDVVPRSTEELVQLVYHYAAMLAYYRVDLVGRRSSIASLPVGPAPISHPQKVMEELELAQSFLYSRLQGISEAIPEVELPLPERDGVWRFRHAQLVKDGLFSVLFPFYRPMRVFGPSREGYEAFLAGTATEGDQTWHPMLRGQSERKYRNRLRLGWLVDRWRNLLLAGALLSMHHAATNVYDAVAHGNLEQFLNAPARLQQKFDPARLNQALDEYEKDPNGFEPVNDHFNKQIKALEEDIRKHGDPDGKKAKHIEELKRRRDFLSH